MPHTPLSNLRLATDISEKMVSAAASQDWEMLVLLEAEERALLQGAPLASSPNSSQETTEQIKKILANHEIIKAQVDPLLKDIQILLDQLSAPSRNKQ